MSRAATSAPPVFMDIPIHLAAVVRADARAYSASIPALPGCHTQSESLDEVRANLRDAAEGWLAVAHEDDFSAMQRESPREVRLRQAAC